MEEFKGTKGEFIVRDLFETYEIVSDTPYSVATIEKKYRTLDIIKSNANLICEAFNVVTRTGLTPEQMEKEIKRLDALFQGAELKNEKNRDLETRLKEACELIEKIKRLEPLWMPIDFNEEHFNEGQALSEMKHGIDSFLTKEKTK